MQISIIKQLYNKIDSGSRIIGSNNAPARLWGKPHGVVRDTGPHESHDDGVGYPQHSGGKNVGPGRVVELFSLLVPAW